ncbi:MAG TPA: SRPBCC domain-containing protein [Candidatus Sulfotelmatobacter sp.]|nr:SRPBCC domain-containing protein [Candidatus Sulfotelmatobacter sp.]
MSTANLASEQDEIVSEIDIAAPLERVFQALSDAAELKLWFTSPSAPVKSWEMDPRANGKYRYASERGSMVVNGVCEFECHGHITEFDPPRALAYTWFANWHDDSTRRTLVRWELTPRQDGTHLRVAHSGLANLPLARKDYGGSWPSVLKKLKAFVES